MKTRAEQTSGASVRAGANGKKFMPRRDEQIAGARDENSSPAGDRGPVLVLTIANGAGHISTARSVADAVRESSPPTRVFVADVADYMGALARFTHVTAYLWLVKHAPAAWDRIDRYQKRQERTSPEWYYRRGLRRLFDLAREMRPRAIVATEVGCCEIAALVKRDIAPDAPLVAVNNE